MIQLQFINYLLASGDSSLVTLNNLNKDFFSDYTEEYKYRISMYDKLVRDVLDFPHKKIIDTNAFSNVETVHTGIKITRESLSTI